MSDYGFSTEKQTRFSLGIEGFQMPTTVREPMLFLRRISAEVPCYR